MWKGITPSGVTVTGYLKPKPTVYPLMGSNMKVKLYWYDRWKDGVLYPEGVDKNAPTNFKGLIFSLLNDDEGHGLAYLSNWIDEGLIEVEKIHNGTLDFYDMWGHAWGAEISKENVLIYWGMMILNVKKT